MRVGLFILVIVLVVLLGAVLLYNFTGDRYYKRKVRMAYLRLLDAQHRDDIVGIRTAENALTSLRAPLEPPGEVSESWVKDRESKERRRR